MKRVFEGKHLLVFETDGWQFAERRRGKNAVAVVAMTADGRLILTEQFRRPVDAMVIDLPAGLVGDEDPGEDAASAARKELMEETGYACDRVELLAEGPTSPGITSERVGLWLATGVRKEGEGGGVGAEDIKVHLVPRDGLEEWLHGRSREGVLVDLKVWGAVSFL